MKHLKKMLAVAAVAASTQSAFAFWDSGIDGNRQNVNDGEMVLTVWDSSRQVSYTQDTGVRFTDLFSGAAFNGQHVNLDSTALSVFSNVFDSNVFWAVGAVDSHTKNASNQNAFTNAGYILSADQSVTVGVPAGAINTNVLVSYNAFSAYATNLQMTSGTTANEVKSGTAAGVTPDTQYQGAFADNFLAANSYQTYGTDLATLNIWFTGFANAGGTQGKVLQLGTVTIDFTAKTLTFNSSAPAVPVPAAAWLMGSALAGLGGIARSRRRNA
jgi:hypothetical protein